MSSVLGDVSLGDLFDVPTNIPATDRIKTLMTKVLPPGWRDWPLKDVISSPLNLDSNNISKLRGSPAPLLDGDPWGETLVNRASSPLDPSYLGPKDRHKGSRYS